MMKSGYSLHVGNVFGYMLVRNALFPVVIQAISCRKMVTCYKTTETRLRGNWLVPS